MKKKMRPWLVNTIVLLVILGIFAGIVVITGMQGYVLGGVQGLNLTFNPKKAVESTLIEGDKLIVGYQDKHLKQFYVDRVEDEEHSTPAYIQGIDFCTFAGFWFEHRGYPTMIFDDSLYYSVSAPAYEKDQVLMDESGTVIKPVHTMQVGDSYSHLFILKDWKVPSSYLSTYIDKTGKPFVPSDSLRDSDITLYSKGSGQESGKFRREEVDPKLFDLLAQTLESADKSNDLGDYMNTSDYSPGEIHTYCNMGDYLNIVDKNDVNNSWHKVEHRFILADENTAENTSYVTITQNGFDKGDRQNEVHTYVVTPPKELLELFDQLTSEA